jgi:hypothetical protein
MQASSFSVFTVVLSALVLNPEAPGDTMICQNLSCWHHSHMRNKKNKEKTTRSSAGCEAHTTRYVRCCFCSEYGITYVTRMVSLKVPRQMRRRIDRSPRHKPISTPFDSNPSSKRFQADPGAILSQYIHIGALCTSMSYIFKYVPIRKLYCLILIWYCRCMSQSRGYAING